MRVCRVGFDPLELTDGASCSSPPSFVSRVLSSVRTLAPKPPLPPPPLPPIDTPSPPLSSTFSSSSTSSPLSALDRSAPQRMHHLPQCRPHLRLGVGGHAAVILLLLRASSRPTVLTQRSKPQHRLLGLAPRAPCALRGCAPRRAARARSASSAGSTVSSPRRRATASLFLAWSVSIAWYRPLICAWLSAAGASCGRPSAALAAPATDAAPQHARMHGCVTQPSNTARDTRSEKRSLKTPRSGISSSSVGCGRGSAA